MGHGQLSLCAANTCWQLDEAPDASCVPLPEDAWVAQVDAVVTTTSWVDIGGPYPALSPHLEATVERLVQAGRRVRLVTGHHGLTPERLHRLVGLGVAIVRLRVHPADLRHGPPSASGELGEAVVVGEALSKLPVKVEVRAALCRGRAFDAATLVAWVARWQATLELERFVVGRSDPVGWRAWMVDLTGARDLAEGVRRLADRQGVSVTLHGLAGPPDPQRPGLEPVPLSPSLWRALRDDAGSALLSGGCHADVPPEVLAQTAQLAGGIDELAHQLAAWRCPVVDIPTGAGGLAREASRSASRWRAAGGSTEPWVVCTPAPGKRVALVLPALRDKVMVTSTFPALADALRAEGASVTLHSAWTTEDGDGTTAGARRDPRALSRAEHGENVMFDAMDLSGADLVVVPGFDAALRVLDHPTLPTTTRVVIADFHLLHGADRFAERFMRKGARSMDGGWWPSERVHVHSCFPGYARIYRFKGIPMRQVLWRPYPFDARQFGATAGPHHGVFAGGNQKRDWACLARAMSGRGDDALEVSLYTRHAPPGTLPPGLTWKGTVDLADFHARLAASRYVVLPVPYERHVASGLTVVSMAQAAGRPVLVSRTPGMRDHVRHGRSGVCVTPGSARELRDAMVRLDRDDAWVATLAAGAAHAGAQASVSAWARTLLRGGESRRVACADGADFPPW